MANFRKRVSIGKGVGLNFSKGGVSTSFGVKGARISVGKRGTYSNLSIPGTGVYSRKKIGGKTATDKSESNWWTTPHPFGCVILVALMIFIIIVLALS